jgi:signal transduction histidine kinase
MWAAIGCGVALGAQAFAGEAPVVGGFLAMLVVLASLGFHAPVRQGLVGLAAVAAGALVYDFIVDDFSAADFVGNAVIVVMAWGLALVVRRSTDARVAAELARDRAARDAVLEERSRIGRDLHDSVAHALTLITLQAGAARERTTEPVALDALGGIETGGRQALLDMHRFLRLIDDSPGETPGLQHLDDLLARMRAAGLTVEVDRRGDLEGLPPSVSATAYRVVQEGLTNTAKHSGATGARVLLNRSDTELVIQVSDEGRPGRGDLRVGSGRGLASLRERLALFDGSLSAGASDGGWRVSATIPMARAG